MSRPLQIIFFGADAIALPLLDWIAGEGASLARIIAVWTQPDRPAGRGQQVVPNAIKAWATARGLPVFQPEKLTESARLELAAREADLGLVMAYGHILRDDFIATPRLGMLNLHTSILPLFRGASPIQSAIASGERETGVTLMRIVRRLDAGPVAAVARVAVSAEDTSLEVEAKLAAASVALVAGALPLLRAGTLVFSEQVESAASYCRKLAKEDGGLDFAESAHCLAARVNGLYPWPACTVELAGQTIKLGLAEAWADIHGGRPTSGRPGEVLGADAEALWVATGAGVLRLRKLQRPGGRMLAASDFLRGFAVPAGTIIASRAMRELVTRRTV